MATEFDLLRQKAQQGQQADEQARRDALKRRFAQSGQTGSGAMIKQEQLGIDRGAESREKAFTDIGIAEAQQKRQDEDTAVERAFREKQFGLQEQGQKFGQDIAGKQFGLQEQQQKFGQDFSTRQQDTSEKQFGKQFGLQQNQFKESLNQFNKQFGLQEQNLSLAQKQANEEAMANAFNFLTSAGAGQETLQDFLALSSRLGRPVSLDELQTLQRQRREDASVGRRRDFR